MPCTVLLELQVVPEQVDSLKAAFKGLLVDTRAHDGCISVDLTQNQDEPTNLVLVEQWQTRAHYEKYLAWREETGALTELASSLTAPPSIRYYDPVPT